MLSSLACLFPCFALASADGPDLTPAFARDNAAFARGLYRQGFGDLAEDFCSKFDAWKDADSAERAAVRSVHLDIKLDIARDEDDPVKRKDDIAAVLKEKEEFITQFPGSAEAIEAELTLPDAYRMLGEAFTVALEKSNDAEQMKSLRQEGAAAFHHAESVLRKRKYELEQKLLDADISDSESESLSDQRAAAWFNIARTEYFMTLLYAKGDPERDIRLKAARKSFVEFSLEYDDKLLSFQGYVFQGFCDKELGEKDQALVDFDLAIAVREIYEPDEKGRFPVPTEIDDVVSWAVLQKMLYLGELSQYADAIEAANDYFVKSPAPEQAQYGLAVLAARADAEGRSGNSESANKTAERLQELDPNGPWGARGREILAKTLGSGDRKDLGTRSLLKIAEALAARNDVDGALVVCVRALDSAGADADASTDVMLMMGALHGRAKDLQAAVVCFDTAWMVHPKSARAAEAIHRAIDCYLALNAADKRAWYSKALEERRNKLANDYATSQYAAKVQLLQGRTLEQDQQFAEAADFFLKVQPGSPNYEEAQYAGARCLLKEAQRLIKAKDAAGGKAMVGRAEEQLKKSMVVLQLAAAKTLDLNQRAVWESQSFDCRTLLANLFMMEGVGRAAEVPQLLEGVEEQFPNNTDKIGVAWSLRIQALNSLGKLNDAENLLEALLKKSPDTRSSATAAGVYARSCDQRALTLFEKDPKSKEGDEAWRKAFRYYVISLKPKLNDAASARNGELEEIGNRFFVMAKHFNAIPDRAQSMVGWIGGKIVAPEYFLEAEQLYAASLQFVQSYRTRISQARALSFIGRFEEASEIYARLFEQEQFLDVAKGEISKQALQQKPELLAAYLEWGVAEFKTGLANGNSTDLLARANAIFDLVTKTTKPTSKEPVETWWNAKYWQIRAWIDEGEYTKADYALRDVDRNTNDFDGGKYGLRDLFKKMQTEVAGKVIKPN